MDWFNKRTKEKAVPSPQGETAPAGREAAAAGSRPECTEHLDRLFASRSKGVVLKLYLDNFKNTRFISIKALSPSVAISLVIIT